MTWWRRLRRSDQLERELDAELRGHIERLTRDYENQGVSPVEARRRAHLDFGGLESTKAVCRETRGAARIILGIELLFDQLRRELWVGARRLLAAPLFTVFAIVTLGIAIGVTTAIYSAMYAMVETTTTRVADPDRLLRLDPAISWPDYQDLLAQQRAFSNLAATARFGTALTTTGSSEIVGAEGVTGEYFATLGVRARAGRTLAVDDDRGDAAPVVMLSERLWRERFSGSWAALGSTVTIARRPFTVIGIVPDGFRGLAGTVNVWLPLSTVPRTGDGFGTLDRGQRDRRFLRVIGRLKADVNFTQAQDDLNLAASRLDQMYPQPRGSDGTGAARGRLWVWRTTLHGNQVSDSSELNRIILGLPMLVFLIACTNLSNLFVSRGVARRHSFAVRRALGAPTSRLVREEMMEAVIVAGLGGVLGVLLSQVLVSSSFESLRMALVALAPGLDPELRVRIAVVGFAAGGALIAMLIAGLIPAWQITRLGTRHVRVSDADTMSPRWRGRSNLIALQVSASVGLFLLAVVGVQVVADPSRFSRQASSALSGVAVAAVPFGTQQYPEPIVRDTVDRVVREIRSTPGVGDVAAAAGLPLVRTVLPTYRSAWAGSPDRPFSGDDKNLSIDVGIVTPGALRVLGVPILSGRAFEVGDTAGAERVAIVDEGLGQTLFGTPHVVDRQILFRLSAPGRSTPGEIRAARIVGVVPGSDADARGRRTLQVYVPFDQEYDANISFIARPAVASDGPPVALLEQALRRAAPDLATTFAGSSDMLTAAPVVLLRFVVMVAVVLAALALTLAMTGLYGVLSHVVTRRTRELGLRMALGADRARVMRMVMKDGIRPVLEGLAVGLLAAVGLRMLLQATMVEKVSPIDPLAFLLATVLLVGAATLACYLPARRASCVDPNVVLKEP